jgi:uncharacterized protein YjbI with pentapeptide repeats
MKRSLETKSIIKVLVDSDLFQKLIFGQDQTSELAGFFLKCINSQQVIFCFSELCLFQTIKNLIEINGNEKFSIGEKHLINFVRNHSIKNADIRQTILQYKYNPSLIDSTTEVALELACAKSGKIGAILSENPCKYNEFNTSRVKILTLKDLRRCIYLESIVELNNPSLKVYEADLRGSNLSGMTFLGIDIRYSDLSASDLRNSNLSFSNLNGINLSSAHLSSSKLIHSILWGANLVRADLSKGNLSCADLTFANLSFSNLCFTNLWGAILINSDLRGADLRGANLTNAQLDNAMLENTIFGNNLGINEKDMRDYTNRGAIFSHQSPVLAEV